MNDVDVRIQRAQGLEDYQACIHLQKEAWAFTDPVDFAPIPLLLVGNRYGGCVLIARVDGSPVGFSYALPGRQPDGALFWWSHMTAVSRRVQGAGVGHRLKLAQRQAALEAGVDEIWWTFDPLQARNAHFNVRKLGAIAVRYEENLYGPSSSPLHHHMPTDRLMVRWQLKTPRVEDRANGNAPVIIRNLDGLVRILSSDAAAAPRLRFDHQESPLLLEIPTNFEEALRADRDRAAAWQDAIRAAFQHYFTQGCVATDFIVVDGGPDRKAFYVLEKNK